MDFYLLIHIIGLIIGLGAVMVIDVLGFLGRNSKQWTKTTIEAHYVTKPLIWIGTILIFFSWIFIVIGRDFSGIVLLKSVILFFMVLNGVFLSFYVSPRLTKLRGKNVLLPKELKLKIMFSMILSDIFWWSFVILTVADIS